MPWLPATTASLSGRTNMYFFLLIPVAGSSLFLFTRIITHKERL